MKWIQDVIYDNASMNDVRENVGFSVGLLNLDLWYGIMCMPEVMAFKYGGRFKREED